MSILCLYFLVTSVEIQCSSLYINQVLLLNCIPSHPFAYFFIEVLLEVQVAMKAARGNPCLLAFNESTS